MKIQTIFCLLSCMLFGQAHATSYFLRGGEDLEELDAALASKLHVDKPAFAKGYVAGAADATAGVTWCPNSDVTEEQIFHAVAKFMKNHRESVNRGAVAIVGEALVTDFPCNKK
jgi:hypothetical protein